MTTHLKTKHLPAGSQKLPDRKLSEAVAEAREADRAQKQKGIDKRFTALKAAQPDAAKDADFDGGVQHPDSEQLEVINRFTRSPKTAEEVVCFPTLSCNDIVDRDFDQFTTETVKQFAELPDPYSSVGKSFMVGHDYNKLPIGRIFDAGTKTLGGQTYLTNWVYMPNTEANKGFIENVDYGINWAVSVGVMLGASECSICSSPMSSMGFCYDMGHMKGYEYDPKSEETDDWGWAVPAEEGNKNAQLCFTMLKEPRDFYELSQVFLGAQYFAALDDKSALGGIVKAASAADVPIIGLSKQEAEELPIPHLPKQVREAQEKFETTTDEDGQIYWTDDSTLRWVFNPEDGEVLCLGKTTKQEEDNANTDEDRQSSDEGASAEERKSEELDDGSGESEQLEEPVSGGEEDEQSASVDSGSEDDLAVSAASELSEEDTVDLERIVREAFERSKVPSSTLDEVSEHKGADLLESVLTRLVKQNTKLTAKAQLGDEYLKDLRAEAIDWYVRAHQDGEGKPVSTDTFQRFLDACGDDTELIKSLIEEKKELAKARFPDAVRRSTFESDPHSPDTPAELSDDKSAEKVRKLHS